jgi:hypothetical protein
MSTSFWYLSPGKKFSRYSIFLFCFVVIMKCDCNSSFIFRLIWIQRESPFKIATIIVICSIYCHTPPSLAFHQVGVLSLPNCNFICKLERYHFIFYNFFSLLNLQMIDKLVVRHQRFLVNLKKFPKLKGIRRQR